MSLMLKLSTTFLVCANLFAASDADVVAFLKKGIGGNPNVSNVEIEINGKQSVPGVNGWQVYFVGIEADVKQGNDSRHINQNGTYFVSGDTLAPELVNLKTGERYNDLLAPDFAPQFYTSSNLISGNASSQHKVAIFSDPLCPFCRRYVPEAINYMAKYPKSFAVYYFHYPLPTLHPAAVTLVKAAIAAANMGVKDVELKLYSVDIDANEKSEDKILDAFNKTFKTKITLADIRKSSVLKEYEANQKIAQKMTVAGTPTVFFDGKKDTTKMKYKQVKVK